MACRRRGLRRAAPTASGVEACCHMLHHTTSTRPNVLLSCILFECFVTTLTTAACECTSIWHKWLQCSTYRASSPLDLPLHLSLPAVLGRAVQQLFPSGLQQIATAMHRAVSTADHCCWAWLQVPWSLLNPSLLPMPTEVCNETALMVMHVARHVGMCNRDFSGVQHRDRHVLWAGNAPNELWRVWWQCQRKAQVCI